MTPPQLALRSTPQQARSQATMQRLLDVSLALLDEVGVDGFNTNLLAERAGVGVRAVYRYFPNKLAILAALMESFRDAERAWVGDLRRLDARGGWRAVVESAIDGYFEGAARRPGYPALRTATQASPELRAIERRVNKGLEDDLADGLAALGVSLPQDHMSVLCRTIMESSTRMLDIALQNPGPEADLLVRELKLMIVSLLRNYLD